MNTKFPAYQMDQRRSAFPGWLILFAGTLLLLASNLFNLVWGWFAPATAWDCWTRMVVRIDFLFVSHVVESLLPLWKFTLIFLAALLSLLR
jgi:hypothetical protein